MIFNPSRQSQGSHISRGEEYVLATVPGKERHFVVSLSFRPSLFCLSPFPDFFSEMRAIVMFCARAFIVGIRVDFADPVE